MGMRVERVGARRVPGVLRAAAACLIAGALGWGVAPAAAIADEAAADVAESAVGSVLEDLFGQGQSPVAGDTTRVEESGLVFEVPLDVYMADDGWWTYLSETEALYFQTGVITTEDIPDVTTGAPDDAWAEQYAESQGYEVLGSVPYMNGTTSFYAYFFFDGATSEQPYVDFDVFVPQPDGSVSALVGFFRTDGDADAMLDKLDAIFSSIELGENAAPAATPQGDEITLGSFAFTLPADVAFEYDAESGMYAFAGPTSICALAGIQLEIPAGSITSVEDLQLAGDEFMNGMLEGSGIEDGEISLGGVLDNGSGLGYYTSAFVSSELDMNVALIPYDDEMAIVMIIDTGDLGDFSYGNDVLTALVETARLVDEPAAESNAAADEPVDAGTDAAPADEGAADENAADAADAPVETAPDAAAGADTRSELGEIVESIVA